jgi:lysophospholipase L1-like esterase
MVVVMGRRLVVLGIVSVLALASTVSAGASGHPTTNEPRSGRPASVPAATTRSVYSLALGDSTAMWNGSRSYPDLIVSHYQATVPHLTLDDMACSGETTSSMITHSLCAPGGSQYNNALSFLHAHAGNIALVTIDIGGNDVVNCIYGPNPTTCFANGLKTMQKNLATIVNGLRAATHPGVPIIGMNYYDPLLGDWLAGPGPTRTLAVNVMAGVATLNKDMTQVYAKVAVPVANVATAFHSSDMTHFVSSPWGRIPVAVDRACTLLDVTCHRNAPEDFGDDPNDSGAVVIAQAFEKTVGHLHTPGASTTHSRV